MYYFRQILPKSLRHTIHIAFGRKTESGTDRPNAEIHPTPKAETEFSSVPYSLPGSCSRCALNTKIMLTGRSQLYFCLRHIFQIHSPDGTAVCVCRPFSGLLANTARSFFRRCSSTSVANKPGECLSEVVLIILWTGGVESPLYFNDAIPCILA